MCIASCAMVRGINSPAGDTALGFGPCDLVMAITSETTMLKQAALALCLTLPVTRGVSADPDMVDVSTWRWNVSSILSAQRDVESNPPSKGASLRAKFFGHYERYWPNGVRDATSKGSGR